MATTKNVKKEKGYDSKVIKEMEKLLSTKKEEILVKYQNWEDKSTPSGMKEMGDIADMASEINEEMLSSVLSDTEIETLRMIELALEKIADGTYGTCEGTGKKIPIARLQAIPWARYTVEYAEIASKNNSKNTRKLPDTITGVYKIPSSDSESMD